MKLTIKSWTLIALAFLAIVGIGHAGVSVVLPQLVVAVVICLFGDGLVLYVRSKKVRISDAGMITGLIVAMVLAPSTPIWLVIVASFAAIASKHLLRFKYRNVFNPATFGLVVALMFGGAMGWWGGFSPILTIVVGAALLGVYPGRWKLIASFLVTFVSLIGIGSLIGQTSFFTDLYFLIGSSFFFIFFMLTDPKTSSVTPNGLILFGVLVAALSFLSHLVLPSTMYLVGLLIANAVSPWMNIRRIRFAPSTTPVPVTAP